MSELVIVRHGETEWSVSGQHTGTTDIPLTPRGEEQGRKLLDNIGEHDFAKVLSSPRQRARRTAELAGMEDFEVDEDLVEWNYGDIEGLTTKDYVAQREAAGLPAWDLWDDGAPNGENADQVGARTDRVLARLRPVIDDGGDVLVARWLRLPASAGRGFILDAAHRSVLTFKRGTPVVKYWNVPPTH